MSTAPEARLDRVVIMGGGFGGLRLGTVTGVDWDERRGRLAWVMWLALHLLQLVGYRNRFEVLSSWAWNYLTADRTAHLMVGGHDEPS